MTPKTRVKTVKVVEIVCPRCGWRWEPKVERPKKCPGCKNPLNWKGR